MKTKTSTRYEIQGKGFSISCEGYSKFYDRLSKNLKPVYGLTQAKEHLKELRTKHENDEYAEYWRTVPMNVVKVVTKETVIA